MIINRFDYRKSAPDAGIVVGYQLLEAGAFDPLEVELALQLIEARRRCHGDGVVAIDCGANIGVHAVEWATATTGWGSVIAIEAQERIYFALAGNIAINNCFNAIAMHAAVSSEPGIMNIPVPDYFKPSSFGSLELKPRADTSRSIIQKARRSRSRKSRSMRWRGVDLIKIDIEGMELEALEGAQQIIERSRPVILVESIKAGRERLRAFLDQRSYKVMEAGIKLLAIHKTDPVVNELQIPEMTTQSSAA